MLTIALVSLVMFILSVVMTMTGRGGGNFYVLTLVLAGIPMHEAATTGQFILFTTATAAALVFRRGRTLLLPLALLLGTLTAATAFCGGFMADSFSGRELKILFAILLALAGLTMFLTVGNRSSEPQRRFGFWYLRAGADLYVINLWLVVPVAMATGFFSGMAGVSGGSFLVPLMVLACGVSMSIAVGTASAIVAATAFAGFLGHALHGSFNPTWAFPMAGLTIFGGILGGRVALKTKPRKLKILFAVTTLLAAILMLINAGISPNP